MKTLRMTDRWLRSVSTSEGRDEFGDAIVRGLRLRVSARSKKWSVVTRIAGKLKRVQMGPASSISLLEARERANDILNSGNSADVKGIVSATQPEKSLMLKTL